MTCETHTHFDWNNIVRTVAVAVVVAPLSFSLAGLMGTQNEINKQALEADPAAEEIEELKAAIQGPCIRYATSKVDTKAEREAKSAIDEALGVEVSSYAQACNFVLDF